MDVGSLSLGGSLSPVSKVKRLFTGGAQGVWFDPSDFGTMFQDSAGTTPVTAVGQPVGLWLDKSNGLVLGPELVANGTFDTDTVWVKSANCTISGGTCNFTAAATGETTNQAYAVVVGKTYKVSYTVSGYVSGSVAMKVGASLSTIASANGTYSSYVVAASANNLIEISIRSPSTTLSIDTVSVEALPGYHATQATAANRPTLGQDASGRYYDAYNGTNSVMTAASGGGGISGIMLCASLTPTAGAGTARTLWSDAGTNTGYILSLNTLNQLQLQAGNGTAYTTAATTDTLTVGTTYLVTAWDDGTNLNVQVASGTVVSVARPVVSAGSAGFAIGANNGTAANFFAGNLYEMLYLKAAPSALNISTAQSYCRSKAGI